jgi:tRNA(fMet)-specific endonuclease VapC
VNGRFLPDTNIVVALFKGEPEVRRRFSSANEVFLPIVAVAELFFGARNSSNIDRNLQQIRRFTASSTLIPCDIQTAEEYGIVKARLKAIGRPIPENDIWIAAIARQYSLQLATRDQHFESIDGLTSIRW